MMSCKHCTDGRKNEYGDEWFAHFECKTYGALYRERPRITKRNNRYFLHVDTSLSMIPIKACPICGRSLVTEEGDENHDRDTALAVLKDLSGNMHPRINMMGQPTLEISRTAFEEVRHKYLDKKEGDE